MKIYEVELEYRPVNGYDNEKTILKTLKVLASDIEEAIRKAKETDYEIVSAKEEIESVVI